MNRALWKKSIHESRWLLMALAGLMFGFHWIFVWVTNMVELGSLKMFLEDLPEVFEKMAGVEFTKVATVTGRIALAYIDPVVLVVAALWGISRGSDVISGEINRGTMELLLAQPVRRLTVLATSAAVTIAGTVVLALAAIAGTWVGVTLVDLEQSVDIAHFYPAVTNLWAFMFFLAATSTLVSSVDNYRWRTIGLMGGFYMISLVLQVLGRTAEDQLDWLLYFTFLAAYEPQTLITDPASAWSDALRYNGILIGLGVASYVGAAVVFCRRDVPAPI